jgi:methylphosphotriester-DNA--protein-cysteine methyltransferase
VAVVEQFLLSKLKTPKTDLLVLDAVQQIQLAKGDIKISQLVSGLHISQDPFEKRFRKLTGTSPKHFSSVVRLRHIIATHSRKKSLTDAALAAGYFDQSHFIKDFRSFTGQSPQHFFKHRRQW